MVDSEWWIVDSGWCCGLRWGWGVVYHCTLRRYAQPFRQPLHTHHGVWAVREGLIVQLQDQSGRLGWGEIAPLDWFGSETLEEAEAFCQQLGSPMTVDDLRTIPDRLPACQFGFESAWEELQISHEVDQGEVLVSQCSGLLPAGERALTVWPPLWAQGYRTFKWKIAVQPLEEEWRICDRLLAALPATAKLRLDANGGLDWDGAQGWLSRLQHYPGDRIEFLEQPLPPQDWTALCQLQQQSPIPIALDESVATFNQLQAVYQQGWRGIMVVKLAIAGYPSRLRHFCQHHHPDLVFSSVFETAVGRRSLLRIATACQASCRVPRAFGFGVGHW